MSPIGPICAIVPARPEILEDEDEDDDECEDD